MIWLAQGPEGVIRVEDKKPHRGRGFYLCPDLQCLTMARGRKKAAELLGAMDFLVKGFSVSDEVCERGGRE